MRLHSPLDDVYEIRDVANDSETRRNDRERFFHTLRIPLMHRLIFREDYTKYMHTSSPTQIPEPWISRFLFGDTRISWIWLLIRVYVGYAWLMAGWEKVVGDGWVGTHAGTALQGFLAGALQKTVGEHPSVSWWYAWFIENIVMHHTTLFSYLVAYGELAVGIGLIIGAFTGIAAFFGAFMNLNFLFAGTVSVNPLLGTLAIFLVLAWRSAGWIGLDRYLLPKLGVPWQPGTAFSKR